MPKQPPRMTALAVKAIKLKGWHRVDANLYLQVTENGNKSWLFRYKLNGKPQAMGLGSFKDMPLAVASEKAAEYRKIVSAGVDPISLRDEKHAQAKLAAAHGMTFSQCANAYIEAHAPGWRNKKHIQQWQNTLAKYVTPVFGNQPAQDVDTGMVMKVLEPIWNTKNETASRVRGRIEVVLDWAKARGFRQGENVARWRGHLENLLPKSSRVHAVKHHPALPYQHINTFMSALDREGSVTAKALQFTILTASRTTEATHAKWDEIDLKLGIWTVPDTRTKSRRIHRVTLSDPAMAILRELLKLKATDDVFIFPGGRKGKPLSNGAMLMLRKRLGYADEAVNGHITIHGFRSTFRDWAAEQTNFSGQVAEAAIAHVIKDKTEAAYLRTDYFEKRRKLMNAWAKYCFTEQPKEKPANNVISMKRRKG